MRNLPRFALVPLAVLISALPLVVLPSAAGADTGAVCQEAFSSPTAKQLVYSTNPPTRLAYTGQTVSLEAGWDPAAWDSLSSAVACVRRDEDTFDDALGTAQASPVNGGAFGHSFTIPEGAAAGDRLCTRIRLAGDPAGEATEAVWVSKMHCFEIDHDLEEETPPDETTSPDDRTPPATQPPATTPTTVPTAAPATSQGTPGDTPAGETPAPTPVSSGGGDSPVGPPFDSAATPAGGPGQPVPGGTPEMIPLLPATGYTSLGLLHHGAALLVTGLLLLVLGGRPRRRRQTA